MKNIVVKGTKKRWKGKWVAGINLSNGFVWITCDDYNQAIQYATVMSRWLADWKQRYG